MHVCVICDVKIVCANQHITHPQFGPGDDSRHYPDNGFYNKYPKKCSNLGTIVSSLNLRSVQTLLDVCKQKQEDLQRQARSGASARRKGKKTQTNSESAAAAGGGGDNNAANEAQKDAPPVPKSLLEFQVGSDVRARIHSPLKYQTGGRTQSHFMKGHIGIVTARQYLDGDWSLLVQWKFSGDTHAVSAEVVHQQLPR